MKKYILLVTLFLKPDWSIEPIFQKRSQNQHTNPTIIHNTLTINFNYSPYTSNSQSSLKAKREYPAGYGGWVLLLWQMTYLPCVIHVMFVGLGIVALVQFVSLKHSFPSSLLVVFDIYTENPKNLQVYPFCKSNLIQIRITNWLLSL